VKKMLVLGGACVLALGFAGGLRADEPKDVIAKAIKAAGGEEKLAKFKSQTWAAKGTYYGMGAEIQYTATYAVQWPSKFRVEIKDFMTLVLDGDKGWIKMGADTNEMNAEQLAEQKETHHSGYVSTLLPLKDNAYTLASLGEVKVGDRPAVGVKVSSKGHRDVNLYFDKETNLLAKAEYTVKAQEDGGKEVPQEMLYSDYRAIEGAKIPMKMAINRDGKKYVEAENTELKPVEKLDDNTFDKP
jgi:outer membrane lipoprotein-sorting protein